MFLTSFPNSWEPDWPRIFIWENRETNLTSERTLESYPLAYNSESLYTILNLTRNQNIIGLSLLAHPVWMTQTEQDRTQTELKPFIPYINCCE